MNQVQEPVLVQADLPPQIPATVDFVLPLRQ